jgi:hypothetical protein
MLILNNYKAKKNNFLVSQAKNFQGNCDKQGSFLVVVFYAHVSKDLGHVVFCLSVRKNF